MRQIRGEQFSNEQGSLKKIRIYVKIGSLAEIELLKPNQMIGPLEIILKFQYYTSRNDQKEKLNTNLSTLISLTCLSSKYLPITFKPVIQNHCSFVH